MGENFKIHLTSLKRCANIQLQYFKPLKRRSNRRGSPQRAGEAESPAEYRPANGSLRERGTEGCSRQSGLWSCLPADETSKYPDRAPALRAENMLVFSQEWIGNGQIRWYRGLIGVRPYTGTDSFLMREAMSHAQDHWRTGTGEPLFKAYPGLASHNLSCQRRVGIRNPTRHPFRVCIRQMKRLFRQRSF